MEKANQEWAEVLKSNKTSIEDKLDMILAQNNEMQVDTERVASLVPLVTGNEAMEQSESMDDASEEINQNNPDEMNPEGMEQDEEDPFAFLDGDEEGIEGDDIEDGADPEEGVADGTDEPFDEAQEESDDIEETPEEGDDVEEPEEAQEGDQVEPEDVTFPDTESDDVEDEDVSEPEPTSEPEETSESDDVEDEDEEEKKKPSVGKSYHQPIRKTRTVQPIKKSNIVSKVSRPSYDLSFGRTSGAGFIAKALAELEDDDFQIGYGVDPHKATEKDWEFYRALLKINH